MSVQYKQPPFLLLKVSTVTWSEYSDTVSEVSRERRRLKIRVHSSSENYTFRIHIFLNEGKADLTLLIWMVASSKTQ